MAMVTRLMQLVLTLVSLATATALAWFGGWLVGREFTADYKESPYALRGVSLIIVAVAISVGLAWSATEHRPRRRVLAALAASAPLLLAAMALPR